MQQIFLGWHQPCLSLATAYLLRRYRGAGVFDMDGVLAALPGRRAGRRLLEMLLEAAKREDLRLVPPRIVTVGGLVDALIRSQKPVADGLARQFAWTEALGQVRRSTLAQFIAHPPQNDQTLQWVALAEQLEQLHSELVGQGLSFEQVAIRGEQLPDFNEGDRWRAMDEVWRLYLRQLNAMGLADPHKARFDAIAQGACGATGDVLLIATADMNEMQRIVIDKVADNVTALIHAPEERSEWFDEYGCLVVDKWAGAAVDIRDEQVEVVDGPAEQAVAALGAISETGGQYTAEQITIGVCDDEVLPYLRQQLSACGLPVRSAAGVDVARTRPMRMLLAVADWLDRREFADFATLIRHPDIEKWLVEYAAADEQHATHGAVEDWLSLMDRYYSDHLQAKLTGKWLGEGSGRQSLRRIYMAMTRLMGELATSTRLIDQWAQPITQLLVDVYGRQPLDRIDEHDRVIIETCDRLHDVLEQMYEMPQLVNVKVSGGEALRLVINQVQRDEPIPPEPIDSAIELLGPLELQLDDADVLIITGFNEGRLPSSVNADAFLPNGMRRHLGLVDNERRYARDAYSLSAILASREHVKLISARRNASKDPLTPSRLMFACDDEAVVGRVKRCVTESQESVVQVVGQIKPGRDRSSLPIPEVKLPDEAIESISVTAFRDYLASPYRFYLRHNSPSA